MTIYPEHYHCAIADRTEHLHAKLDGSSVFVVGKTGFYGSWFAEHLRYVGVHTRGGSRSTGLDIEDERTYPPELLDADWVINCAGDSSGAGRLEPHALGPQVLRRAIRPDATLLHFSSGVVARGSQTPYAEAKRISQEALLRMGGRTQIVQPFATVGPGMGLDKPFAVSSFLRAHLAGQSLRVTRRPVVRSFCHITDLLVQCLHVMALGDGQPYEVGSDDAISIEAAARAVSQNVQLSDEQFASNAAQDVFVADLTRTRTLCHSPVDMDSITSIVDIAAHYTEWSTTTTRSPQP